MFFNKNPQLTFDDVASDRAKLARARIMEQAAKAMMEAVEAAEDGEEGAARCHRARAEDLRWLAISMPLDMGQYGL